MEPQVTQYGNNMVMTNVMKPTIQKLLNVDTRFVDTMQNHLGEYVFTLPERITEVTSMKVLQVEIPMSFYNISSSLNNTTLNIDSKTYTLPNGNYTLATLMTTLNRIVSHLGVSFQISDSCTCSITNQTGKTVSVQWYNEKTFSGTVKEQLGWVLGFRKSLYTVSPTTILVGENSANMNTVRYMFLLIDDFNHGMQTTFISPLTHSVLSQRILCRI